MTKIKEHKKLISIVVAAYNEESNLEELYKQLIELFTNNNDYEFEVFFIDNGSQDTTWCVATKIANNDKRFNVVKLARNFLTDGAITAGLTFINGDAAVMMAGDLQDPPQLISQFIKKWEVGYENVYQIVSKRSGTSFIRKSNSQLFYWLVNVMTKGMLPKNVSDFRLVDKKVYLVINQMHERNRFIRGLFAWIGFKSIGIPYERPFRHSGHSKANTLHVLSLAMKGIFAHSYIPLQMVMYVGILVSVSSFFFLAYTVIKAFLYGVPFAGYGSIMGVVLLMFGFLFIFLGIIGKYIGLIYEEVKVRPNFIVSEVYPPINNK
ncbi:glycosyltransferase family 2 protein [Candidatus Enterovibrio escicola]|uniref:Polymyxin resistance protein ArnC, glycosyl transferase n=1 Tax=Candidatus Enterovibrio escicola TaxID=1927127 RepID=A0A2A5T771_9GAMM|nr:glycosyltransferase family 2 protein [Candidatus Enterovibrio escacola]PCS23997.1 Polymyxin resistance protein ArnC, glycosyl transferase [Candidatus Enterovibrio escacola]